MDHPDNALTLRARNALDYYDQRSITLTEPLQALEAWNLIMAKPSPLLGFAFRIRDAISARFGVRRIGGFTGERREAVSVGERLDFFLVEVAEPNLLVLTERDKHLDVMTSLSTSGNQVMITSSVVIHNWFGRAYMLPVGLAHKLIVHQMLRRLARSVAGR